MVDKNLHGDYEVLKIYYQHASARASNPSWDDIDNITKGYDILYQWEDPDPHSWQLVTHIDPFYNNNNVPKL